MADSILAASLTQFAASESDPADEVYRKPFTFNVEGQTWAVAVTGPTLMAVKGKASYPLFEENKGVLDLMLLQADKWEEVALRDLRTWCGPPADRDDAVINGYVFNRARLGKLLVPCLFPKLRMGTTYFGQVPAVIVEAVGKWRVVQGGVDCDPEPDMPVWGKASTVENQLFDLAMSLE